MNPHGVGRVDNMTFPEEKNPVRFLESTIWKVAQVKKKEMLTGARALVKDLKKKMIAWLST